MYWCNFSNDLKSRKIAINLFLLYFVMLKIFLTLAVSVFSSDFKVTYKSRATLFLLILKKTLIQVFNLH